MELWTHKDGMFMEYNGVLSKLLFVLFPTDIHCDNSAATDRDTMELLVLTGNLDAELP